MVGLAAHGGTWTRYNVDTMAHSIEQNIHTVEAYAWWNEDTLPASSCDKPVRLSPSTGWNSSTSNTQVVHCLVTIIVCDNICVELACGTTQRMPYTRRLAKCSSVNKRVTPLRCYPRVLWLPMMRYGNLLTVCSSLQTQAVNGADVYTRRFYPQTLCRRVVSRCEKSLLVVGMGKFL